MPPLPLAVVPVNSSSVCFWTSAERRSRRFRLFPTAVLPPPLAPWQSPHWDLNRLAASACARTGPAERSRETTSNKAAELIRAARSFIAFLLSEIDGQI